MPFHIPALDKPIPLPIIGSVPLAVAGGLAVLAWFIFVRGRKPKRKEKTEKVFF